MGQQGVGVGLGEDADLRCSYGSPAATGVARAVSDLLSKGVRRGGGARYMGGGVRRRGGVVAPSDHRLVRGRGREEAPPDR